VENSQLKQDANHIISMNTQLFRAEYLRANQMVSAGNRFPVTNVGGAKAAAACHPGATTPFSCLALHPDHQER